MFALITTLSTNLLRTYIIYRFMRLFFWTDIEEKKKERACYVLFFVLTAVVHLIFCSPGMSVITNIVLIFLITVCYEGALKKKIFVTLLVYVLLLLICDVISEKILIKNKGEDKTPHGMILAVISALCLAELLIVEQELKNRILLVLFGCCVLAVVLLIFYLYDVLISAYKKLEEQSLMEKQMLIYSHQLDVLMQSEEKVKALRHDLKNHLGELALMAGNQNNEEIRKYIQDMGEYMQNQSELVSCGNKNLDSLLNYLLGQAKKKLNHVEYEVRVPSDLCISAFDLNVILGNLTENAIEAAEQTKDKWMSVDIYYEKGMLSMEIKNSFQHELAVEKNKLLSTKEEKGHGIGLANVRKMVEKYQGFMDVSNTNQIFTVKVMLYL